MGTSAPWEEIQFYLQHRNEPFSPGFRAWLEEHPDNQHLWEELSSVYALSGQVPEFFTPDKQLAWKNIEKRTKVRARHLPLRKTLLRIAASFLILILGATATMLYQQFNRPSEVFTEIFSPFGHKTMVVLPDSSKVWLNGNTKIRYEATFRKTRHIELSGEALFEVHKSKSKRFIVAAKHLKAEVYGTTFNFKAYDDDPKNEIALVEGSLAVFRNGKKLHHMKPDEILTFYPSDNRYKTEKGNMAYITSWSSDELVIYNESFESMLKYLERWYGVEFEVSGNKQIKQKISFKLKTESLNELLPVLARIVPMKYEVEGKKVQLTIK
jgi:ferric-dicitrate binding protein FerR (iron transport regulator)